VEQKKTQYALLEEKKAESDLRMKIDIKTLLEQIMLLKGGGQQNLSSLHYSSVYNQQQ